MPVSEYAKVRKDRRQALVAAKRNRRLHVGPYATFHFENYDSMWHQVHEMLYIEKGGEAQIEDELRAYNPLIPNGSELIATVMFEIDDERQRRNFLAKLGGVEETAAFRFDGETVRGVPEADMDRTNAAGKASSVQFIHFPFTPGQIAKVPPARRRGHAGHQPSGLRPYRHRARGDAGRPGAGFRLTGRVPPIPRLRRDRRPRTRRA